MKVFVVEREHEYEGSVLQEIFSTYDKAMEFIKKEIDNKDWEKGKKYYDAGNFHINLQYGIDWNISEWDVNEN